MFFSSTARRVARPLAALCALALFAAGCESPSGAEDATYTLVTINGQALPASSGSQFIETTSGSLELDGDGSFELTLTSRCRQDLPPGSACEVYDGGVQSYTGAYSRSEGWLRITQPSSTTGEETRFQATFASEGVVLRAQCSPGTLGCPLILTFER